MKKYIIPMAAVLFAIAASAFTTGNGYVKKGPETIAWFQYMGDPANLSQVKDNTEYQYTTGLPCSGSNEICAVQTSGTATSGHHPDAFSADLKSRLTNVFNGTNTYADITQEP